MDLGIAIILTSPLEVPSRDYQVPQTTLNDRIGPIKHGKEPATYRSLSQYLFNEKILAAYVKDLTDRFSLREISSTV